MSKNVKLIITGAIVLLGLAFFEAFALMFMWNKFIPAVTGNTFVTLNYWAAYGIMLITDLFTVKVKSGTSNNSASEPAELIGAGLAKLIIDGVLIGIAALVSLGV